MTQPCRGPGKAEWRVAPSIPSSPRRTEPYPHSDDPLNEAMTLSKYHKTRKVHLHRAAGTSMGSNEVGRHTRLQTFDHQGVGDGLQALANGYGVSKGVDAALGSNSGDHGSIRDLLGGLERNASINNCLCGVQRRANG